MSSEPPQDLIRFAQRFPNDAACADYLFAVRYPNGYQCFKCGSKRAWRVAQKPAMMICENAHKISVTAGTAMHRTKVPLPIWFHAAWLMATIKPGISAVRFQQQLGLSRLATAWTLLHKLRSGLAADETGLLSAQCASAGHANHWIEVDEVCLQPPAEPCAGNHPHVALAVEVHSWRDGLAPTAARTRAGQCRMQVIASHNSAALQAFAQSRVAAGAPVRGCAQGAAQSADRAAPQLATAGRVARRLRTWLDDTHGGAVRGQHLASYVGEFCFRFNGVSDPWHAFGRSLGLAVRPPSQLAGVPSSIEAERPR